MGSSGKRKTTFAKLARESKLRERRFEKQAKKDARKRAAADQSLQAEDAPMAEEQSLAADAPVAEEQSSQTADAPLAGER